MENLKSTEEDGNYQISTQCAQLMDRWVCVKSIKTQSATFCPHSLHTDASEFWDVEFTNWEKLGSYQACPQRVS